MKTIKLDKYLFIIDKLSAGGQISIKGLWKGLVSRAVKDNLRVDLKSVTF